MEKKECNFNEAKDSLCFIFPCIIFYRKGQCKDSYHSLDPIPPCGVNAMQNTTFLMWPSVRTAVSKSKGMCVMWLWLEHIYDLKCALIVQIFP